MFGFIIKKLLKNKWMVLCLLAGYTLVIAMVSSIPTYTDAILERLLTRDLENYQLNSGAFAGNYSIGLTFFRYIFKDVDVEKFFCSFDDKLDNGFSKEFGIPTVSKTLEVTFGDLEYTSSGFISDDKLKHNPAKLKSIKGMSEHIKITHGKAASSKKEDGIYEVVLTEKALNNMDLVLNNTYELIYPSSKEKVKVRVVGTFSPTSDRDTYWSKNLKEYDNCLFLDYSLFYENFIKKQPSLISEASWNFALDYHKITTENIKNILAVQESQQRWFAGFSNSVKSDLKAQPILIEYSKRQKTLKLTLWILIVPVLLVLIFYIFMVTRLIIEYEKNEIAIFRSRGASRRNIIAIYSIEGVVLSGIAFGIGPLLGLFMCRLIGSSNGFLEFIERTGLNVALNKGSYLYSAAAAVFLVLTMVIEAFLSTNNSIVQLKQQKNAVKQNPVWKKYFIDVVILLLSMYGLYRYHGMQAILMGGEYKGADIGMDPLLFLISTFFVLGTGLLFLRCYPFILSFIFRLGKKIWSPVFYVSFVRVGRTQGEELFLMLFIIFALSIGVFSANSARTLNANIEDRIRYEVGSDIKVKPTWGGVKGVSNTDSENSGLGISYNAEQIKKLEPPIEPFTAIEGIEKTTKVYIEDGSKAQLGGGSINNVRIMGIIPGEFGRVSNLRRDLLPHHWFQYLNLISKAKKGFLVSKGFEENYKAKAGDAITVSYTRNGIPYSIEGMIYAFVDFWPAFNPYIKEEGKDLPMLVVGNLSYIQESTTVEPYEIWMKKKVNAKDDAIYKNIGARKLAIDMIDSANQEVIKSKNDPAVQGINGTLTLGFIVTMLIITIGFIIYWVLSIRGRILQFGVFRAIGLPMRKIIGMLACEQLLISGASITAGMIIGYLSSQLFIPLLQMAYKASELILPFKVMSQKSDYIKIYGMVFTMLLSGLVVLGALISKININQAIKLGED